MTRSGPHAGLVSSPFAGVAMYGHGDQIATTVDLSDAPGRFRFDVRGASSNATATSVTILLDGAAVGTVT